MRTDDSGAGPARSALSDLPLGGETWEVGAYAIAELLGADPGTLPPAVFILIGARKPDRPVAAHVHEQGDIATAAADLVVGACHEPAEGSPRLPAALVVDRPEQKTLLEERFLGTGVSIRLESSLPILEALALECFKSVLSGGAEGSYADAGVPMETAQELFDAARTFHKAAPWKVLDDTEPLELQLPGPDGSRYAVVMGAGELTTGLALFRDVESLASMYNEAAGPIGATLSLTYDARADVPAALVEEARREKWKLASSKAFPIAMSTAALEEPGGVPDIRYVNGEEAEELVLALRAVAGFCTRHRRELQRGIKVESAEPTRSATGETVIVRLGVLEQVKAMGGKASGLPTLAALQKRIREAESPIEVLQPVADLDWWLIEEATLFTAFFQRLWNMTPRPDLGGRSPDEVYRSRPPSPPGGGGKRRPGISKKRRK